MLRQGDYYTTLRESIKRVLIIGSGAIKIAEAAEFDYSGTQALKAVKEEGIETILVNPNVATIQTSHLFADKVYLIPLKPEFVAKVIERERPDGIMIGFGGQTALSIGVALWKMGILQKYDVKVLGDGWTAVTEDKSLPAQFEHTIGITENGYEIFTESVKSYTKPPY